MVKQFRYLDGAAILLLDAERCIGCGSCVTVCPHRVLRMEAGKATVVDRDGCMECGACATNCPVQALYVNPDDGCGCATHLIKTWLHKHFPSVSSSCGC